MIRPSREQLEEWERRTWRQLLIFAVAAAVLTVGAILALALA